MQIWAYKAVPELDELFDQRVGERSPRLLCWTSTKQSQQRTYDAFFRDLHVHGTLRSTEAERDLSYITSLVPFPNCLVQFLDDLDRSVVGPQFHEAVPTSKGHDGSATGDDHYDESGTGAEDDETSASDDRQTPEGNDNDGSKADENGDSSRDTSIETGAGFAWWTDCDEGGHGGHVVGPCILFEMRLRTVMLEIIQNVTEEFARLSDFISTLVPPPGGTSTSAVAPVVNEPNIWDDPHEDGEGSDERSPQDDDHADEGEMQEANDGKGEDKQSPQDNDHAEEGDMQEVKDSGETVPTLSRDDNEDGP
ncbi:Hypothetical predicted protein [Olea europaea subsp. europaea]|uniref:Uncharacterized protein n=1 Tax=Olea europaea subsp. europaea TaxID=158383 RepID=A0A8S0TJD7_OLEEU|nr:Hypothetical predicted protein [Olea europaea subsp. europaea]